MTCLLNKKGWPDIVALTTKILTLLYVSLLFYHISSVTDFTSAKYISSMGHKDSW